MHNVLGRLLSRQGLQENYQVKVLLQTLWFVEPTSQPCQTLNMSSTDTSYETLIKPGNKDQSVKWHTEIAVSKQLSEIQSKFSVEYSAHPAVDIHL